MTCLKLSPVFKNLFDFCRYKLCDVVEDERKIRCGCGYRGVEKLDFVDKYSQLPHHTIRGVLQHAVCARRRISRMLAADVAKINWKTAKRIDKKYLNKLVTGMTI